MPQSAFSRRDSLRSRHLVRGAVVLFCLVQLSRFYLTIQLDPLLCWDWDPNHNHAAMTHVGHEHSHDHGLLPESQDHGFFFQHCKEAYNGIGLIPVQPLPAPVTVSFQPPAAAWGNVLAENPQPIENYLPPPFHPPRNPS